jgi:DNA (cytosine-5)-methyltransferase 1
MLIATSYFSTHTCLGGACIGAKAAGLTLLGGIEIDPYPVELYRKNFGNGIRHESILDTPIHALPDFDFLWSSPSCQSFSSAKTDGKELDSDIEIAKKVAEIVAKKSPRYFALENVRGYLYKPKVKKDSVDLAEEIDLDADEDFSLAALTDDDASSGAKTPREFTESFKLIYCQLESMGYNIHFDIYDVADFGVPQNRNRLILRASRDPLKLLQPTHCKTGNLFWPKWNGWYEAIADLLPTCKRSHLTERQILALENKGWYGEVLKALVEGKDHSASMNVVRTHEEPSNTVLAGQGHLRKVVLVEGKDSPSRDRTIRTPEEPCMTITVNQGGGGRLPKAVLVDGKGNLYGSSYTAIDGEARSFTVTANMDRNISRAVLLNGSLGSETNPGTGIDQENPAFTVTSNDNMLSSRAVLLAQIQEQEDLLGRRDHYSRELLDDGRLPIILERTGYGDRDPIIRNTDEPCQTIRSSVGCDERGGFRSPITALLEQADVRALDYRCLARLQSIPDWYEFGDRAGKNCEAIGNAVPPLFAQRVIESMVGQNA